MTEPRTRRTVIKDVVLYAVLALPVVYGVLLPPVSDPGVWWLALAGVGALGAAVALTRTRPLVALLIVLALVPLQGNFAFSIPVMSYLTGRRTAHARPVLWAFTAVLVLGAAVNIARGVNVVSWFPLTLYLVVIGVLPWLVGRYWRQYQELVHAGWERAERLEREQRIVAERERLRERARIAQDMHDSLGHELALIAVRAGALQVAPGLDERHRGAAAELRASAADATERLREIIGVLGDDAAPDRSAATAPPADESIADLVERARTSGIPVTLDTGVGAHGAPGGDGRDGGGRATPPARSMGTLAAHRVVQEALTNAARHAPGAPVTVRVRHEGGAVAVTVTNLPPSGPALLPPGGGRGLTGLAERVRLAGGTLRTGATGDGGFEVAARLPLTPDASAPAAAAPSQAAPSGARPAPENGARGGAESRAGGGEARETARRLALERRQVRRGLLTAIGVPAVLAAVLGAVMLGYYAYATLNSVLDPGDYRSLRVGQPRAEVERVLPRVQLIQSDAERASFPAPPAGSSCEFYRSDGNLLGIGTVYRLCFAGDRLAGKDATLVTSEPGEEP
ncbi:histidine kinase [Spirillospora sp. NPDC047279]|uniref:sensor histidine kinase n=1 Tax=Spirillospora sp. NPDC047279 TaxID=3155478 RepID=UPI0033CB0457